MNQVVNDMEEFLDEEIKRLAIDKRESGAYCETELIKAKLASLLVKYGYEK